jgi:glyoxylase-like metal-dependent hydrolase (beta-lactamase superfamily II)
MTDDLLHIADNVWLFPADPAPSKVQPAVGIVLTPNGTVAIDTGNSPRHARHIQRALAAIDAPPVTHIIYTHFHWDHVYGAQVFVAPAIAHELCRESLIERAARPWSYGYIEEEIRRNPTMEPAYDAMQRAVEDWHGFHIVVPSITFTNTMALHLAGTVLELEHVGGQHSPDSIVVRLPSAGVIFLGDCYYKPPLMYRTPDARTDYAMIERLLADERIHTFIDAHSPPRTRDQFAALLNEPS